MKIYIAHMDDQRLGGGWSFIRNLARAIPKNISSYEEADVFLIPSPSICSKEEVDQAKADGKKIVLRIDNIVRNSRNRNTGMSRMKRFADQADVVIYQSAFAQALLAPYTRVKGKVILNGCDQKIFNRRGRAKSGTKRFVYSRVNRDETKNWEMARYIYQAESKAEESTMLHIVGEYSPELVEYNFDFYQDEEYKYWGVVSDPHAMADIYRNSDNLIYTFFNDACSNTLIEALSCGCNIVDPFFMARTGGAPEIITAFVEKGPKYLGLERMGKQYLEAIA